MRPIKNFQDYVDEGIVIKKSSDISRSNSFLKEAQKSEDFIQEINKTIGINDDNANSVIKLIYDVIMEKIRSRMILKGYFANGQGAHEAEVSYLKILDFSEQEIQFCDQLRFFRNGILYYGKTFDGDYAKKSLDFLKEFNEKIF